MKGFPFFKAIHQLAMVGMRAPHITDLNELGNAHLGIFFMLEQLKLSRVQGRDLGKP